MRVLGLFSGIGGFELGLQRAGMTIAGMCEIDPYCQRVLAKHWPEVPIHDDITTRVFAEGEADIITGGFPCQDVSLAGKRAGVSGARSGLYRELVRAICVVRPKHAILENVAALLGDGMGRVLGDLAESGFDAEWDCVPAQALGAPHERDRVFIVAHAVSVGCQSRAAESVQSRGTVSDRDGLDSSSPEGRALEQSWSTGRAETAADAASERCGQGRPRGFADSFAGVRDQARRNAADPMRSRLSFGESLETDACSQLSTAERAAITHERQSLWPDEPALCGVDDGVPNRVDRIRALGNALLPQIPELIGRSLLQRESA